MSASPNVASTISSARRDCSSDGEEGVDGGVGTLSVLLNTSGSDRLFRFVALLMDPQKSDSDCLLSFLVYEFALSEEPFLFPSS